MKNKIVQAILQLLEGFSMSVSLGILIAYSIMR